MNYVALKRFFSNRGLIMKGYAFPYLLHVTSRENKIKYTFIHFPRKLTTDTVTYCFIKGSAVWYHIYVIMHVKDSHLSTLREGCCNPSTGFFLSLYSPHVLNGDVDMMSSLYHFKEKDPMENLAWHIMLLETYLNCLSL